MSTDQAKKSKQPALSKSSAKPSKSMGALVLELIAPYKKWLFIIFSAMLLETAMSLFAPWPLKIVLDNVVGHHPLPRYLAWIQDTDLGANKMAIAAVAAIGLILIAVIGAIAGYIDNYYTESVAQNVANDMRLKVYHHLQRLSLSYYDSHQIGTILSTMTSDISTIQSFASTALLSILIDGLTILGMLILMFYLNWDFALVAVSVTPFLLLFVARFKKAVKKRRMKCVRNRLQWFLCFSRDWSLCARLKHLAGRIWKKYI